MSADLPGDQYHALAGGLLKGVSAQSRSTSEAILAGLGYYPLGRDSRLNSTECEAIVDGFKKIRSDEDVTRLEKALKKRGFIPKKDQKNRKPGPPPKAKNPSEEEVLRLLSDVRASLAIRSQFPKLETLQVVSVVLAKVDGFFRRYLFLTPSELAKIRVLRNRASELPIDFLRDFVLRLDALIAIFNTDEVLRSPHLKELILDAKHLVLTSQKKSEQSNEIVLPDDVQDAFVAIGEQLGLDDPAGLRRLEAEAKKEAKKSKAKKVNSAAPAKKLAKIPAGEQSEKAKRLKLGELTMRRPVILRMALGRLRHLHQLFVDTDQAFSRDRLTPIYEGLQGLFVDDLAPIQEVLEDQMSWNDPQSEVAPILTELKDVFLEASKRQGIHPFSGEKLEEAILTAEPVSELENSTGGYLDSNRSVRAKATRQPFKAAAPQGKEEEREDNAGKKPPKGKPKKS